MNKLVCILKELLKYKAICDYHRPLNVSHKQ